MADNLQVDGSIEDINIEDSIKTSYLDYSMSVIIGRALPDVRDGLKPVHRRILYAMKELGITSKTPFKKSARIVGEVIGKFHPHGDTAVYDALVRMAQPFSLRAPLIDGQGNFGSIDGDNAAAMRYTESRMTQYAQEMLKDIDKDTVDFNDNYDSSETEPSLLPCTVPNLLVNGSSGIAVGMATNIPPHNLGEIVDAVLYLLENPKAELLDILTLVKGPDFPTAATIFGKKGILDAYTTGRGRLRIRAKTHIEQKGSKEVIVIDELPYQVNKSRLIENIAILVREKTLEGISEIRDESDREGIRVVIELKRDAMSEIVLNNLYKSTNMQTTFGIILLAIVNQEPKVFNLLEMLNHFISHRKTVVIRRTIFDIEKARAKAHILEGLQKALDNIEQIIKLIRASSSTEDARNSLVSEFSFSQRQAQAILDMRLQKLTSLEREKIANELSELLKLIKYLDSILKSEQILKKVITDELDAVKDEFTTARLTEIVDDYDDIDIEDLIPNEPMVVSISHRGYIKRVPLVNYEKQKRGGKGKIAVTTYDDDYTQDFFTCTSHDTLLFITNFGQLHWLKVYRIPQASKQAKGKAVVNLINLKLGEEIRSIIPTSDFSQDNSLVLFTKNGIVKRTNLSEFSNVRNNGVRAIVLDETDTLVTAKIAQIDTKYLFIVTKFAQCIKFEIEKTREQGRTTRGVRGIKFKIKDDCVVDANVIEDDTQEILMVSEKGMGKRTTAKEYRLTNRGGSGVISMKLPGKTVKTPKVVGCVIVDESMDMMALTSIGKMIRTDMQSIRKAARNTSGVKVVKIDAKDIVVSIARCPKEEKKVDEDE